MLESLLALVVVQNKKEKDSNFGFVSNHHTNNSVCLSVSLSLACGLVRYIELPIVDIADMPKVDITSAVKRTLNDMTNGDEAKAEELQDAFVRYADAMSARF